MSSGKELALESGTEGLLPPLIFNLFPRTLQVLFGWWFLTSYRPTVSGLFFYRFTQEGDMIHFLCPVGGTGVGRQHVWTNPYLGEESSPFSSVHSAVRCLTPKATANRLLKIDVVRYSSSSNSELVFLEGKRYSDYRTLEFQRLLLTYKSCKGRRSYICIVLSYMGCVLPHPLKENGICFLMLRN